MRRIGPANLTPTALAKSARGTARSETENCFGAFAQFLIAGTLHECAPGGSDVRQGKIHGAKTSHSLALNSSLSSSVNARFCNREMISANASRFDARNKSINR